jgi:hypothetical protein
MPNTIQERIERCGEIDSQLMNPSLDNTIRSRLVDEKLNLILKIQREQAKPPEAMAAAMAKERDEVLMKLAEETAYYETLGFADPRKILVQDKILSLKAQLSSM